MPAGERARKRRAAQAAFSVVRTARRLRAGIRQCVCRRSASFSFVVVVVVVVVIVVLVIASDSETIQL